MHALTRELPGAIIKVLLSRDVRASPYRPGATAMPETVVHFQIRMPPVLHEQLASWAKDDKASLNALIVGILEKAIAQHEAKDTAKAE